MKQRPPSPPPLDLHRRESVRAGLLRITRGLADAAKAQAARPALERDAAVHLARLILKRARSLVRLLGPTVGKPSAALLDRRLRLASRGLAVARDLAVGLATLDALARDADSPTRAHLERVRAAFATGARRQPKASPAKVSRALTAAGAAVWATARSLPRLRWEHRGWAAIDAGLHATYRRARRRFKSAHTDSSPKAFHRWRTAIKALQYHLTMLRPASPKRLGTLIRDIDRLAGLLGGEHDLAVLCTALARHPARFGGKAAVAAVRSCAANRQQTLRKEALKLGRRLLTRAPREFVGDLHPLWKTWRHGG